MSKSCLPLPFLCPIFGCAMALLAANSLPAAIVSFEDVGAGLGDDSFYNGGPANNSDGWDSGGVHFKNTFTDFGGGFTGWTGWAYSNVRDNTTAGFLNQYAAHSPSGTPAGHGAGNSRTYALAFTGSEVGNNGSVLNLPALSMLNSVDINNTTYALLGLRDGNDGGANLVSQFQDGDYFRLQITGFDGVDGTGTSTGQVQFDLANYGGAGTGDDFYLDDWHNLDLSGLGPARSLQFSLDSNVIDTFGNAPPIDYLNTPSYVAIDNLSYTVPEPGAGLVLLLAAPWLARRRRAQP